MNANAMIWSVRRELWENRSIYVAPVAVMVVAMFGGVAATAAGSNSEPHQFARHLDVTAGALMATTLIVAIFYCVDALYGERRDRSVLFWKSMPVSDVTTVLSKLAIPLIVLPIVTFIVTVATQFFMLLSSSAYLSMRGQSAAPLWNLPWLQMTSGMLYHVVMVHSLYYAPIFGWLLLVSAWAKRMPFIWAFLPLAAIGILEKLVFNTTHFAMMLQARLSGGMGGEPTKGTMSAFWPVHPMGFIGQPGLWIGFVIAAVCIAGAVVSRRSRDPI